MNRNALNKHKSIKERLSQYYLNLSEKKSLQRITSLKEIKDFRERQKKDSLEYKERSKRPDGNDLKLHSFYLYDIFLLEDFSELGKKLDNLFAKSLFNSTHESYQSILEQAANQPGSIYFSLPLIVGNKSGFFLADRINLDHIPNFIKYIECKIAKILPSLVVMAIRVVLDEEMVNAEIDHILGQVYQQRIIFDTYFPWKIIRSGVTWYPAHHEKKRECYKLINGYKLKTECFMAKYFNGIFLSKSKITNRCPSMEIYTISQLPGDTNIIEWARSSQEFWRLIGFGHIHNKLWFKNNNSIYCPGSISEYPYANKLIIDKSSISGPANIGDRQSILKIASDTSEEYIASLALIGLFAELNKTIQSLKTTLFVNMKKRRISRFKRINELQNEVSINEIKIDNVVKEYESARKDNFRNGEVELKDLADEKTLSQVFIENVEFMINEIKRIIEPIKSYTKEYFSNENTRSNYLLQKRIFILTIIICLLALLPYRDAVWKIIVSIIKAIF